MLPSELLVITLPLDNVWRDRGIPLIIHQLIPPTTRVIEYTEYLQVTLTDIERDSILLIRLAPYVVLLPHW